MNDLTKGTPWKKILFFALPILGSSLIQQLYSTVDLIFVGRFIGKEAAAAVGSSDLLVTLLVGLFTGISVGSSVVAAQAFGSGDKKRLHRLIQNVFSFGVAGSAVLLILGQLLAPTLLHLMNAPEEIMSMASTYLRIYFFCIFSLILYNLGSGIIRAIGDSVSAMRYQIIGGFANVLADFVFIYLFHWGVAGAALATFCSQTLAAIMTIHYLTRLDADIALRIRQFTFEWNVIVKVLNIGIPSGVQSMIMTFSNILVQSVINGYGVDTIAAFVSYFKVELFLWYPMVALGQALVTYTAQNVGAGEHKRVKQGLITTLVMGVVVAVAIAGVLLFFARPIFSLFNTDINVIEKAISIAKVTFPLYTLYLVQESFSAGLKGHGNAVAPMIIGIACICGARISFLYLFTAMFGTIQSIASVYPISWGLAGIFMMIAYMIQKRKIAQES